MTPSPTDPRLLLYSAPFCVECERARTLLERHRLDFDEIDLSRDPERCCELEALTGGRSAPQLLLDGRPIGGYAQLAALVRRGELAQSTAGATR